MKLTDLTDITRFEGLEGKLTKIGSKRPNSQVVVSQNVKGDISLVSWPATDKSPEQFAVMVIGMGMSDYLRTSPIVKIVDATENSVTFETAGGVYKLERI